MAQSAKQGIGRNKVTGLKYRYEAYEAWGQRYFNCDLKAAPVIWHKTLAEARKAADANGTLEITYNPELERIQRDMDEPEAWERDTGW